MKNSVYLISHDDGTYEACVSPVATSEKAALLTTEGEYPVKCYYRRMDANGDGIIEMYECVSQEELIDRLNYNGNALHTIQALWDFDSYKGVSEEVCNVFNAALDAWAILSAEEEWLMREASKGQAIGTPTVKELVAILSKFPEDYRVSCCGADCFIHLFEGVKYITIDNEQYLN